MSKPTWESTAWKELVGRAQEAKSSWSIAELLKDGARAKELVKGFDGTLLDVTRTKLDVPTLALLVKLAEEADVQGKIKGMVSGATDTNPTEKRAVLHTALRCTSDSARFDVSNVAAAGITPRRLRGRED